MPDDQHAKAVLGHYDGIPARRGRTPRPWTAGEGMVKKAQRLENTPGEIGQWWGTDPKKKKQTQIDIVGTPVEGKDYIIGSCKYRNEKIGVDELDLIRDYASVFGKGNNYYYYIFSKGGFTDGLLQAQERGEVRLIMLEDLYK